MVEHFSKVAAIHPPAARCASIKMLSFFFERIGHATTDVLPARKLNDRALRFSHLVSSDKRNPARVFELRAGPAPQSHRLTANQRRGSYSLPPRLQSINLNGKTKPPDDAEPNAKLSVAVMVETGDSNLSHPP